MCRASGPPPLTHLTISQPTNQPTNQLIIHQSFSTVGPSSGVVLCIVGFLFLRIPSPASPPRRAHDMFHLFGFQKNPDPDMFHDMFVQNAFRKFQIVISPDLDGYRAPKDPSTICFTICLFISPDLDGHRPQISTEGMFRKGANQRARGYYAPRGPAFDAGLTTRIQGLQLSTKNRSAPAAGIRSLFALRG